MKILKALLFPAFAFLALNAGAQTLLVDFGNNGTNGSQTPSPSGGNYWNNSFNGGYTVTNMVTTSNGTTTIDLTYTTAVATNTAALSVGAAPSPFNITTAYEDAIFTTGTTAGTGITVRFSQLDLSKTYKFTLFGSRSAADSRTTNFEMVGATTSTGSLQTSGTNLGGSGINYNNSSVLVLGGVSGLAPNASSQIDLTLFATSTDTNKFGYLNAMQIEVIPEPTSAMLIGLGLAGMAVAIRRRRR